MSHAVLDEPNKSEISTQEGERETPGCEVPKRFQERDMTSNIPARECQIHLCLSDR